MKNALRTIVPRFVWESLRQARIARRVKNFPRRVVEHDYGGNRLKVLLADRLAEGWYDHDWGKLHEIEVLAQGKLRTGATVFDLGAHQGVVALMLAKRVGRSGRVVAVEGMQHNADVARQNADLNDASEIIVRHAVIGDQVGQVRFFDGLNGSVARDGVGHLVDALTIDSLAEEYGPPDVLFVDIEGFELHALRGATSTLEHGCDWFVEVHLGAGLEQYGGSAAEVLAYFPQQRYERYVWRLDTEDEPQLLDDHDSPPTERFALVALSRSG